VSGSLHSALRPLRLCSGSFGCRSGRQGLSDTDKPGAKVMTLFGHACQQRSRSLTGAASATGPRWLPAKREENYCGPGKGGAGFGTASREGGNLEGPMHLARAGEIVLVELLDAAWHGTRCRDPSTHLASLRSPRISVGMTGFGRHPSGAKARYFWACFGTSELVP
jgi:hypothetical protein